MSRRRRYAPLSVYLNSRLVGRLNKATSGAIDFQYDQSWLDWQPTFAVSLSLPLREDRYIGAPVTAVFENLLPDEPEVRRQIAARQHADGTDAFSLLSAIGRDCIGALQFLPDGTEPGTAGQIDARTASNAEIEDILAGLAHNPLGLEADAEFRISLAGAQEKTALLWWQGGWHIPHGTTATTHILKPSIGQRPDGIDLSDSVENEHLCLRVMAALGMPVAHSEMARFGQRKTLVVERFDRQWTKDARLLRLPQEDFCQARGVAPAFKYEADGGPGMAAILETLRACDDPRTDQRTVMKAAMIYWLLAATDAHAKNYSIALLPGGGFRLTPLYDVMSVQPLYDRGQLRRNQMKLAVAFGNNRHYRMDRITARHFDETAKTAGLPDGLVTEITAELVADSEKALTDAAATLPNTFPEDLHSSIYGGYRSRLQQLERWLETGEN